MQFFIPQFSGRERPPGWVREEDRKGERLSFIKQESLAHNQMAGLAK